MDARDTKRGSRVFRHVPADVEDAGNWKGKAPVGGQVRGLNDAAGPDDDDGTRV
jgi:hypothetical protein